MNQEIEIEFKNILSESEFTTIKKYFQLKDEQFKKQRNFYFDSPSFSLAKQSSALRIREKNGAYELTLKQPHKDGLLETNSPIRTEEALSFIEKNQFPVSASKMKTVLATIVNPNTLICLGELTTLRCEWKYGDGYLALDRSFYLGIEDFEIEYEVTDKQKGFHCFIKLLNQLKIKQKPTKNKIKRFFEEKRRQNL